MNSDGMKPRYVKPIHAAKLRDQYSAARTRERERANFAEHEADLLRKENERLRDEGERLLIERDELKQRLAAVERERDELRGLLRRAVDVSGYLGGKLEARIEQALAREGGE